MPNNCNSIFNKFFVLLLSGLFYSCSSIYPASDSLNEYSGKIMINSGNYQKSSFNLNIISNESTSIIQVNKAFIGNVVNIRLNANKESSSNPLIKNNFLKETLITHGQYFQKIIFKCLSGNYDLTNELFKPKELYIDCFEKDKKINFNIRYKNYEIKSFLEGA